MLDLAILVCRTKEHFQDAYRYEDLYDKKSYIGYTDDAKGTINSNRFKLGARMHRNKRLQNDWDKYGESNFSIQILEVLPYYKII